MAIDVRANARMVGDAFAQMVSGKPEVRRLWVSPDGDTVHIWLEVGPIDREQELALYGLVDGLYDRFEGVDPFLHVMNPLDFTGLVSNAIPSYADEVALHNL